VIIPMIAANLANSQSLVRVVVPRPLLLQTAQLLQARLGGLIGRKFKHVLFSRRSPTEIRNLRVNREIHYDVLRTQGVILTIPEHILSFKLSRIQELSNGQVDRAAFMMGLETWFGTESWDILDEYDYMLAVKTQLIYSSGSQSMFDGHCHRWNTMQRLLRLVKIHVASSERIPEEHGSHTTVTWDIPNHISPKL